MAVYCAVKSLQPKKREIGSCCLRLICSIVEGWKREIMLKYAKQISRWWLWICYDDMIRVVGAVFAPYGSVAAGISLGFFLSDPNLPSCWNKVLPTKHKKWLTNLQHVQFITGNCKGFLSKKQLSIHFPSAFHPLSIHFPSTIQPCINAPWHQHSSVRAASRKPWRSRAINNFSCADPASMRSVLVLDKDSNSGKKT